MKHYIVAFLLLMGLNAVSGQEVKWKWWVEEEYKNAWTIKVTNFDQNCEAVRIYIYRGEEVVDVLLARCNRGFAKYTADPKVLRDISGVWVECIR